MTAKEIFTYCQKYSPYMSEEQLFHFLTILDKFPLPKRGQWGSIHYIHVEKILVELFYSNIFKCWVVTVSFNRGLFFGVTPFTIPLSDVMADYVYDFMRDEYYFFPLALG